MIEEESNPGVKEKGERHKEARRVKEAEKMFATLQSSERSIKIRSIIFLDHQLNVFALPRVVHCLYPHHVISRLLAQCPVGSPVSRVFRASKPGFMGLVFLPL